MMCGFLAASVERPANLTYTLNKQGLQTIEHNGVSFFSSSWHGNLRVANSPVFRRSDGTTYTIDSYLPTSTNVDPNSQKVSTVYPWGTVTSNYRSTGNRLIMKVVVTNTTSDLLETIGVQALTMSFPEVPQGSTVDAQTHPLHLYPLIVDPKMQPGVIHVDYGSAGVVDYANEGVTEPVILQIPFSSNNPVNTLYPFWATTQNISTGTSRTINVSLRFGKAGVTSPTLSGDLYQRYAEAYPFQVQWSDRRPIGALFLGSAGIHPSTNPRGWFNNATDVDITTPAGKEAFRVRLLAYADSSIKVLKELNSQGMVTWDPEGMEFGQSTYYGDPRLVSILAPEMEYKGSSPTASIDAYFKKFTDAGLKVGLCIRPQQIRMVNGLPVQEESSDQAKTLKDKITYALKRWGVKLFYIDSTVDRNGPYDPAIIKSVADTFPDVLLMPEHQSARYYAYSAPFESFLHHGVTSTSAALRVVYPGAFIVNYAADGDLEAKKDVFLDALRRGDILMTHGWYDARNNAKIKALYKQAELCCKNRI